MKSDKSNLTVRYADGRDTDALYKLWKECFHDTDAFMAYYFDYYLRDNRILILAQENQLKSMIHLNPIYIIRLRKEGQQPICCRRCHRCRLQTSRCHDTAFAADFFRLLCRENTSDLSDACE